MCLGSVTAEAGEPPTEFYRSYLEEVLAGSVPLERYRELAADPQASPEIRARAALRLVPWMVAAEDSAGAERYLAMGYALSRGDAALLRRADEMANVIDQNTRLALNVPNIPAAVRDASMHRGDRKPYQGPPPGAEVPGGSARERRAFRLAEERLAELYREQPKTLRLEGLRTSLQRTENMLQSVVSRFRGLVGRGGPVAVAAQLRIGAALHDSALTMLALPPELNAAAVAGYQRKALIYLQRARRAYQQVIARAAVLPPEQASAVRQWREAAESGKLAVDELLK